MGFSRQESSSFLKKRTKKLLRRGPRMIKPYRVAGQHVAKVFCFFFSKKKAFLPLRIYTPPENR
jgi:hypothetical protein